MVKWPVVLALAAAPLAFPLASPELQSAFGGLDDLIMIVYLYIFFSTLLLNAATPPPSEQAYKQWPRTLWWISLAVWFVPPLVTRDLGWTASSCCSIGLATTQSWRLGMHVASGATALSPAAACMLAYLLDLRDAPLIAALNPSAVPGHARGAVPVNVTHVGKIFFIGFPELPPFTQDRDELPYAQACAVDLWAERATAAYATATYATLGDAAAPPTAGRRSLCGLHRGRRLAEAGQELVVEADEAELEAGEEAEAEAKAPMDAFPRSRRMHELRCTDMVVRCPGFYNVAVMLCVVCIAQLVVLVGPMVGPILSRRCPGGSDDRVVGAPASLV